MNSTEIFQLALNLSSPWFVEQIKLQVSDNSLSKELHIFINFPLGSEFILEDGSRCKAYDTEDKQWQHLNFFEHKCFLHARVPRVVRPDGTVKQVAVPWARAGSGFTLMFEAFTMLMIENEMPVNNVADTLKVTAPRLWRVFNYWVDKASEKENLSAVKKIGADETSRKKGHDYITVFVDLDENRVIDVELGRDKETFSKFADNLENKGGDREKIEQVSIDMSPSFIAGTAEFLPKAKITFDKYHLIAQLNKAMDEVRKAEYKENKALKGHKYTLLKDKSKLSGNKQNQLDYLLSAYPTLGEAYRLKELFRDIFKAKPEQAKEQIKSWCEVALQTTIQPFIKFANLVESHWAGILNYFDTGITNAILESINAKIQLAKKRARGYRNNKNLTNMIYFLCGKLKMDYPRWAL